MIDLISKENLHDWPFCCMFLPKDSSFVEFLLEIELGFNGAVAVAAAAHSLSLSASPSLSIEIYI